MVGLRRRLSNRQPYHVERPTLTPEPVYDDEGNLAGWVAQWPVPSGLLWGYAMAEGEPAEETFWVFKSTLSRERAMAKIQRRVESARKRRLIPRFAPYLQYNDADIVKILRPFRRAGAFLIAVNRAACLVRLGAGDVYPSFPERSILRWPSVLPRGLVEADPMVDVFVEERDDTFVYLGDAHFDLDRAGDKRPGRGAILHLHRVLSRSRWLAFQKLTSPATRTPVAEAKAGRTLWQRLRRANGNAPHLPRARALLRERRETGR